MSGTNASNSIYLGSNLIGQYDNESGILGENIFLGGHRIAAVGGASVTNGGFESGSTGWTLTGVGASIVTNATNAHSGSKYLQISTTTSTTAQSPTVAVHPGDQIGWRRHSYHLWSKFYGNNGSQRSQSGRPSTSVGLGLKKL